MLRRTHRYQYLNAKDMTTTFEGTPIDVEAREGFSVIAAWTQTSGTLSGTIKLQASNNYTTQAQPMASNPDNATWTDVTGSLVNVSGSGSYGWNVSDVYYAWVRVVYTATTGVGTANAYVCVKD